MGLHISWNQVPVLVRTRAVGEGTGSITTRGVYGNEGTMGFVTRSSGYHTTPHRHDSEQINYILDGEMWFFVGDKAYRCRPGDFQRVPQDAIHWAWNRSDKPVTAVEMHTPPPGESGPRGRSTGLFGEGETPRLRAAGPRNEWITYDAAKAEQSPPLTGGLYVATDKLPVVRRLHPLAVSGRMEIRGIYGARSGFAKVTWLAGYHSLPYVHDAEALLHILEGEIWTFVENMGFRCQAGDFLRVPRNAIHWEWNPSTEPARALVEYCPPVLEMETIWLKGGVAPEGWVALFDDQEKPRLYGNAGIFQVNYDGSKTEALYGIK